MAGSVQRVKLADLKHYRRNARVGNVDVVKDSLAQHGQVIELVVDRRTKEVLAGNHTLKAMRALGWTEGLVRFVDVDDAGARRINLVDNRASDVGGYDKGLLLEQIEGLDGDLDGSGWTDESLNDLFASLNADLESDMVAVPSLAAGGKASDAGVLSIGPTVKVKLSKRELDALDQAYVNFVDERHDDRGFMAYLLGSTDA